MMDFFFPIPEHFCPLFAHRRTNCPDGVFFCPDGVSFRPDFHPQPLFFTLPSHTPFGDMYVHKTPLPPPPKKNSPFQKQPPAQPCPMPARAGSRPQASCSALENALRVVRFHLQSAPARAAAQMRRGTSSIRRRECCSVRLAARCCDRKMRRRARRQHQSGGTNAAA